MTTMCWILSSFSRPPSPGSAGALDATIAAAAISDVSTSARRRPLERKYAIDPSIFDCGCRAIMRPRGGLKPFQQLRVAREREPVGRVGEGDPRDAVDLLVRLELAADRTHHVVAHDLRAGEDTVAGLTERTLDRAVQPRLLLDLAERALLVALTALALPLRERPVVVLRTVDEQHVAVTHDDAAGGADDPAVVTTLRHAFGTHGRTILDEGRRLPPLVVGSVGTPTVS